MLGRRFVVGLLVLAGVALSGSVAWSFIRSDRVGWVQVATLEYIEERGVVYVESHRSFVSVTGAGHPIAVSAVTPHYRDLARFCPSSRLLESDHGKFDRFGIYLGGGEPRSLDRLDTRVREGIVEVNPTMTVEGPDRGEVAPLQPDGQFCNPYDLGRPGFFADRSE